MRQLFHFFTIIGGFLELHMSLSGRFKLYFFGTSQIQDISHQNSHPTMTLNFKLMHTHWQGPNDTEWNSAYLVNLDYNFGAVWPPVNHIVVAILDVCHSEKLQKWLKIL